MFGGDHHKIVDEILIPELRAAGKEIETPVYPGQPHGFGMGIRAPGLPGGDELEEAAAEFFSDMHAFFKRHLPIQPKPVDDSMVKQVSTPSFEEFMAQNR